MKKSSKTIWALSEDQEKVLLHGIGKFGNRAQIRKSQEELLELIVALQDYLDDPLKRGRLAAVIDELADVNIMMVQMSWIFGAGQIGRRMARKIEIYRSFLMNYQKEENPHE